MSHEQFILSLLQLPGVGRKTAWKIVGSASSTPKSGGELFSIVDRVLSLSKDDCIRAWGEATKVLDAVTSQEMSALAATNPKFPQQLKTIPDPPLVLFMRGDTTSLQNRFGVAVIGTREPSDFGKKVAFRFGKRGAEAGCVVISGLAIGCDSEAHKGCLEANGRTVAVMAHGLDYVYPKASEALAHRILERGGCWVSEYAPGVRAHRSNFIERDRLQSGLAGGVIVVETDIQGGTMHTVRFAEIQGRLLAALSHPPSHSNEPKARGNFMLIQESRALALKEADDLVSFIASVRVNSQDPSPVPHSSGSSQEVDDQNSGVQKELSWPSE